MLLLQLMLLLPQPHLLHRRWLCCSFLLNQRSNCNLILKIITNSSQRVVAKQAAACCTAAAAVAAHSHCSYCILAVNYLPLCLLQRGRGRIEKSEDSRQENVGESRRRWSDQLLLLLLPACSSIENVLLHASTVNACQFLLLLLLPLHLRLILQQLPTSCGICANVNKLINCLYSAVEVDDFYRRCI